MIELLINVSCCFVGRVFKLNHCRSENVGSEIPVDLGESLLAVGRPIGNFVQMFWSNVADSSPSSSPMSLSVTPSLFHSELKTYIYSKKIFHHGHPHPSVLTDF